MTFSEDLEAVTNAISDALSLINGHLELSTEDAPTTIYRLRALLASPAILRSADRTRLRALNEELSRS